VVTSQRILDDKVDCFLKLLLEPIAQTGSLLVEILYSFIDFRLSEL
jgi:hypothetical protein